MCTVIVAIAVHGLTLVGDGVLHPSLLDVTVPFARSYMRLATTWGIIAGWALIFLGLSFYARDRIGRSRWKVIHRFTLLAWLAGVVHTIIEGTDVGTIWSIALLVVTTAPVLVLLAIRIKRSPGAFGLSDTPAHPTNTSPALVSRSLRPQQPGLVTQRSREPQSATVHVVEEESGQVPDPRAVDGTHLWAS